MIHLLVLDGSIASSVHTKNLTISGVLRRIGTKTLGVSSTLKKTGISKAVAITGFIRLPTTINQLFVTAGYVALRLIGEGILVVGGSTVSYINPQSDAEWELTVKDKAGTAISDATVTATIYSPSGTTVASNVSMPHSSGGKYTLTIASSWSDNSGLPIEGEFVIIATVTRSGVKRTKRFRYVVRTDDQD